MTNQQLQDAVRNLMFANTMEGYSSLLDAHYCYVAPSKERYQFQWFWDTCFHVFILCALNEVDLAARNMQSLFKMQEDNGFIGHMIFWKQVLPHRISDVLQARPRWQTLRPHMSALIQPPLIAQALKRIYETSRDKMLLYDLLPKIVRFHDWLAKNRDFDSDGLLTIISPFESGIDWKPSFDEVIGCKAYTTPKTLFASELYWRVVTRVDGSNFLQKYNLAKIRDKKAFLVKEVLLNTMYACDLRALAELCEVADLPDKASLYRTRAEKVGAAILTNMYDAEYAAFYDMRGKTNAKLKVLTAMSFMPLLLPEVPEAIGQETIGRHFKDKKEFLTTYPIPSVAVSEPSFYAGETLALWRGATWPIINWLLFRCFRQRGFEAEANIVRDSVHALIKKSGFREYYNPFTGEGYGARNFTWSGLVVDMN
jgi:glycogen debranching enzyme